MIEIIHVSDLHFGQGLFFWFHNRKVRSFLKKINNRFRFSDNEDRYLLVTGDITQHGNAAEYNTAAKALMPFKDRIFLTPGNHDYGSLFGTDYSEGKARYFDKPFAEGLGFTHGFSGKKVFSRILKDSSGRSMLMIIGLNSCSKTGIKDFAQGKIGRKQRDELNVILTDSDARIPKLLFLHHIPNKDADWEELMTLHDWRELMEIVKDRVNVIAFGHQGQKLQVGSKSESGPSPAKPRSMQKRYPDKSGRGYVLLDADSSVDELSYYYITLNGRKLDAEVRKV